MTEITGNSGLIPALPEYPGQPFIATLPPDEWQACLDLWIYSVEYRLRMPAENLRALKITEDSSELPFLLSYLRSASESVTDAESRVPDAKLRLCCHLLFRRLCLESELLHDIEPATLYDVLAFGSTVFKRMLKWPETLRLLSKKVPKELIAAYGAGLHEITQDLSSDDAVSPATFFAMRKASNLISAVPEAGMVFMTGTDYLDSLAQCYEGSMVAPPAQKVARFITEHTYICLRSLMTEQISKMSMLLDHLYSLKASADVAANANPQKPTLLSSLVCLTTLLRYLEISIGTTPNARGQKMLASLQEYRQRKMHLHPQTLRPKTTNKKGKGKAGPDTYIHIHKASQISQIHDLFPDLPTPYVLRLLDHYSEDIERVIEALLEPDSLPVDLRTPTEEDETTPEIDHNLADLAPRSTPPFLPQKKSVFDNDDFDNLRISPAKLHRGRKDKISETPTTRDEHTRSKAAIMAALAAFDADDDERDDTYDVADVGGTVDDTLDSDEVRRRRQGDPNEQLLFSLWKVSKEHFARDSKTRLSQARQQLKIDSGMTDEQIEGWGLMLSRDSTREHKLQQRYLSVTAFGGDQNSVTRTKWSASRSGTATEEEDSDFDPNNIGGPNRVTLNVPRTGAASVRGASSFGTGRGGSTAGPASAKSTQIARKHKEQGRGSGGPSHGRREGRAKKIGRGMTASAPG